VNLRGFRAFLQEVSYPRNVRFHDEQVRRSDPQTSPDDEADTASELPFPLEAYLGEDYVTLHAMECDRNTHGNNGHQMVS